MEGAAAEGVQQRLQSTNAENSADRKLVAPRRGLEPTWAAVGRPVAARASDTGWGFNARIQAPNGRSGASGRGRASNPGQPGQLTPEIAL